METSGYTKRRDAVAIRICRKKKKKAIACLRDGRGGMMRGENEAVR